MRNRLYRTRLASFFSISVLAASAFLAGCGLHGDRPEQFLAAFGASPPGRQAFTACNGFGCETSVTAHLDDAQWALVRDTFDPAPIDAAQERRDIARAVGLLERLVARQAGTENDQPENERIAGTHQLDCMAETFNTTSYLLLMQGDGLLRFHAVVFPQHRGTLIFYPHNTAVIAERESGRRYAVDSWFGTNGDEPDVVDIDSWLAGFDPRDEPWRSRAPQATPPETGRTESRDASQVVSGEAPQASTQDAPQTANLFGGQ